ncbi:biopolymer transporter ExbD [Blastopirellula sp. JC732]|uniref:Biopolymer transporter ExbD n=1 Tax=Blastopirellula sediminis TaxID=2894196 RepID=A0A9X1MQK3_9BACT|nr:biopolymer transporter ExbD [Blastopirellula sediminis]MCC9605047.1 biopolymer transporter ExbD [Blastopirellula sediminis]MCC9631653.1 biopolymer transporter ExbD [Blastopirellula sediminis]
MAVKVKKSNALLALNITPLIDVVFLLLVFFMVMTRFDEEDYKLDVALPAASEAQPLIAQPRELIVNIDADGKYHVRGDFVTLEQLENMLQQTAANNPDAAVIIRADRRCRLEFPVSVMNACNKVHLTNYSLTTSAPERID